MVIFKNFHNEANSRIKIYDNGKQITICCFNDSKCNVLSKTIACRHEDETYALWEYADNHDAVMMLTPYDVVVIGVRYNIPFYYSVSIEKLFNSFTGYTNKLDLKLGFVKAFKAERFMASLDRAKAFLFTPNRKKAYCIDFATEFLSLHKIVNQTDVAELPPYIEEYANDLSKNKTYVLPDLSDFTCVESDNGYEVSSVECNLLNRSFNILYKEEKLFMDLGEEYPIPVGTESITKFNLKGISSDVYVCMDHGYLTVVHDMGCGDISRCSIDSRASRAYLLIEETLYDINVRELIDIVNAAKQHYKEIALAKEADTKFINMYKVEGDDDDERIAEENPQPAREVKKPVFGITELFG